MQAPLSFVLPTARSSGRSTALFDPRRPRGRDPPLCSPPSPAVCTASCSVRQARAHCDASLVASYLLVLIALPPISQRSARTSFQRSARPSWTVARRAEGARGGAGGGVWRQFRGVRADLRCARLQDVLLLLPPPLL
ncbi:unnamed protein product [Prorocentrum cordatum]|uniref:Uncharacterized protein n=1 Tax=Prorocentrum cordatum TaxID=2364126 RepID=A0ABN9SM59_9DINO|nr:unnamed protein product [Polarella glacialis]